MARRFLIFGLVMSFLAGAALLPAQEAEPGVVLKARVEKEVLVEREGKEVRERIPVETAATGDVLVYTVAYRNEGDKPVRGTTIVNPLPEGAIYVPDSAKGEGALISFSVDGGRYYQVPPVRYLVKNADGTTEERLAPTEMYTHVRWVIEAPVAAGGGDEVEFKVWVR